MAASLLRHPDSLRDTWFFTGVELQPSNTPTYQI
jgi:hypothetical protein